MACGWVESWIAGNATAMQAAVDAMATWPECPLLQGAEMHRGWALNIEQAANRIASDRLNYGPGGIMVKGDGAAYGFGPQWSLALGCDPRWRRPIGSDTATGSQPVPR